MCRKQGTNSHPDASINCALKATKGPQKLVYDSQVVTFSQTRINFFKLKTYSSFLQGILQLHNTVRGRGFPFVLPWSKPRQNPQNYVT